MDSSSGAAAATAGESSANAASTTTVPLNMAARCPRRAARNLRPVVSHPAVFDVERGLRRAAVLLRGHEPQSAVDHDRLAREVRGLVAADEGDERGDLARVAGAAGRDAGPVDGRRVDVLVAGH